MLRLLSRIFQAVLCLAALVIGVLVGEWFQPTAVPTPPPPPKRVTPSAAPSSPPSSTPSSAAREAGPRVTYATPLAPSSPQAVASRPAAASPRAVASQPAAASPEAAGSPHVETSASASPALQEVSNDAAAEGHPDAAVEAGYADIDAHALAAPTAVATSVPKLAKWLVQGARNDREKARALFRWIAANITYRDGAGEQSADRVLKERSAVCQGYAELFRAMASEVGLTSIIIAGWGRTTKNLGRPYGEDDLHAWNAVSIDGEWALLDATWGAGARGPDGKFARSFRPFYFLTPARLLIYDHFPKEERWQLLEVPMTVEAQRALPAMSGEAWALGIAPDATQGADLQAADGTVSLRARIPQGLRVHSVLRPKGTKNAENAPGTVQERHQGSLYEVRAACPKAGSYELTIFAGRGTTLGNAISYRVTATTGAPPLK